MDNPEYAKLAEAYNLIYTFLSSREHAKAAKSVKKAAKESGVVSIKSNAEPSTLISLENIIFEWHALSTRNVELEALSKHLLEDVKKLKKLQKHKKDSSDSDSSSTSKSSSSSSSSTSSSSPSSSDSDTLSGSKPTKSKSHKKEAKINGNKKQRASSATSDSDEEFEVAKTVLAPITPLTEIPNPTLAHKKDESSSDSDEEESKPTSVADIVEQKTLKRRRTENGVVTTAVEVQVQSSNEKVPETIKKGGKEVRRGGVPFQRIKVNKLEFQDARLMDNTFAARRASEADYGAKASQDLIVTRGAGFRKEKNKKKRGSYRGGDITMESHSIKFE